MSGVRVVKKELRRSIREKLSNLTTENVQAQSSNVVAKLMSHPRYQAARRISIYLSMPGGEIQTQEIVRDAIRQGKEIFIPYTHKSATSSPSSVMDMVKLHSLDDYESLQPDKWGIPTPTEESISTRNLAIPSVDSTGESKEGELGGLDVIIMPGMAFDSNMGRLGHGKGYYDYFLQRCKVHANVAGIRMPDLIGLALKEQLLDDPVPMDETDWRLDWLITDDSVLSSPEST